MESKKRDIFLEFHRRSLQMWRDTVSKFQRGSEDIIEAIELCLETGETNVIDAFRDQLRVENGRIERRDSTLFGKGVSLASAEDKIYIWKIMDHLQKLCNQWDLLMKYEKKLNISRRESNLTQMLLRTPRDPWEEEESEDLDEWCVLNL